MEIQRVYYWIEGAIAGVIVHFFLLAHVADYQRIQTPLVIAFAVVLTILETRRRLNVTKITIIEVFAVYLLGSAILIYFQRMMPLEYIAFPQIVIAISFFILGIDSGLMVLTGLLLLSLNPFLMMYHLLSIANIITSHAIYFIIIGLTLQILQRFRHPVLQLSDMDELFNSISWIYVAIITSGGFIISLYFRSDAIIRSLFLYSASASLLIIVKDRLFNNAKEESY